MELRYDRVGGGENKQEKALTRQRRTGDTLNRTWLTPTTCYLHRHLITLAEEVPRYLWFSDGWERSMSQKLKEGLGEVWFRWSIRNNYRICTILPPRNIIWLLPQSRFPYSRQHKWWYRNCVEWGLLRAREPHSATTVYYIQQYLIR